MWNPAPYIWTMLEIEKRNRQDNERISESYNYTFDDIEEVDEDYPKFRDLKDILDAEENMPKLKFNTIMGWFMEIVGFGLIISGFVLMSNDYFDGGVISFDVGIVLMLVGIYFFFRSFSLL